MTDHIRECGFTWTIDPDGDVEITPHWTFNEIYIDADILYKMQQAMIKHEKSFVEVS